MHVKKKHVRHSGGDRMQSQTGVHEPDLFLSQDQSTDAGSTGDCLPPPFIMASLGATMSKSLKVTSSARVFLTPTVPHRVGLARRVEKDPSLHRTWQGLFW